MDDFSSLGTLERTNKSLNYFTSTLKAKLWKKKSVTLTDYDPVYKVIYLGNVLTPWAKGDGCCDKPLATLWRNYCSNVKHEIYMKVTICASGLKAITREHGLTEYWSNRITYCYSSPDYPKVFCWIYRHEAKKLKQELRCHAVLCSKESKANEMQQILSSRLSTALEEFKREKRMRQNSRLLQSHFNKHSHHKSLIHYERTQADDTFTTNSTEQDGQDDDADDGSSNHRSDECDCAIDQVNGHRAGSTSSSIDSTDSSNNSCCTSNGSGGRRKNGTLVGCSSSSSTSSTNGSNNNCINGTCGLTSSLPSSATNYGGIPVRKRHLVKGQANFRPPLERSKSAPRLTSIDEEEECNNLSHLLHLL